MAKRVAIPKKASLTIPVEFVNWIEMDEAVERGGAAAGWLWVRTLAWSRRSLLDGVLPHSTAHNIARNIGSDPGKTIAALVAAGLWTDDANAKVYRIANYAEYADTRATVEARLAVANRPKISRGTRASVAAEATCGICGEPIVGEHHIDHIVPVSKGGGSNRANLRRTHPKCNLKRGNKVTT